MKTTEPTTKKDVVATTKPTTTTTLGPKTNKVAGITVFRWTFGTIVGIVALVSLVLVAIKIRKNHGLKRYKRLQNEARLVMGLGELDASSQSLVMTLPN